MSDSKPALVIQQTEHMSKESLERVVYLTKRFAAQSGFQALFMPIGVSAQVDHGTGALVAALHAQTEAINRLADSNQQVIDYLLSEEVAEAGDVEGSHTRYLDPDEE
ncbi:MAG: hypothetical protein ACTIJ4_01625 [Halomonas sp.]|uniref:hypothetical protein n=1 Tax=Halomonas sp. TaxID=1486246 RepID=UPI003F9BA160